MSTKKHKLVTPSAEEIFLYTVLFRFFEPVQFSVFSIMFF